MRNRKGTSMYYVIPYRGEGVSEKGNFWLFSVSKWSKKGEGREVENARKCDYVIHEWSPIDQTILATFAFCTKNRVELQISSNNLIYTIKCFIYFFIPQTLSAPKFAIFDMWHKKDPVDDVDFWSVVKHFAMFHFHWKWRKKGRKFLFLSNFIKLGISGR